MSIATTAAPLLGEPLPVELMNSLWADREGVHDALATPAEALAWVGAIAARPELEVSDLSGWLKTNQARERAAVHESLRGLRDAARCLAARRTEDPRDDNPPSISAADAVDTVNEWASSAPAWPFLKWPEGGVPKIGRTSTASPGQVLVAELARSTVALLGGDAGSDLRACLAPGCVLYFVKHHPRREWCSDVCGNRARQARHYQRNRSRSQG